MPGRYLGSIVVPSAKIRNNRNTGASVLDLGALATNHLDTKVRAHLGGVAGDSITIACIGDSAAGAGVSISVSGLAVTIHYESGVSTVALIEAALAALATPGNANDLIDVDVAGTGATVLSSPGDDFTATHLASGAAGAFVIPTTCRRIRIVQDGEGSGYATKLGAADLASISTDAAKTYTQVGATSWEEALGYGFENGLAVYSPGAGGTIKVFSCYGPSSS